MDTFDGLPWVITGSGNDVALVQSQVITWTNDDFLLTSVKFGWEYHNLYSRECIGNVVCIMTAIFSWFQWSTCIHRMNLIREKVYWNRPCQYSTNASTALFNVCSVLQKIWLYYLNTTSNGTWHTWWRHQIETFSALLGLCEGNSPVTGEFPAKDQSSGALMFSSICSWKKQLKQVRRRWFETPSRSLWRQCNENYFLKSNAHSSVQANALILRRSVIFEGFAIS